MHYKLDSTGQVLKEETFDASFPGSYDVHGNLQRNADALGVQ